MCARVFDLNFSLVGDVSLFSDILSFFDRVEYQFCRND